MLLKDTEWHTYHEGLSRIKGRQRALYIEYYNRALDMYLTGSRKRWPPSLIEIYGNEFIASTDARPLELAAGDITRDIYEAECILRPRWHEYILRSGGGRYGSQSEALRLWKIDGKDFDADNAIAGLKIQPD